MQENRIDPDQTPHSPFSHDFLRSVYSTRPLMVQSLPYWNLLIVTIINSLFNGFVVFYAPPPNKWRGIMLYPLKFGVSVRPSVFLSVRPSFSTPTIRVPATPTVLGQSFSNFTGAFRMVCRYAFCFFRVLK